PERRRATQRSLRDPKKPRTGEKKSGLRATRRAAEGRDGREGRGAGSAGGAVSGGRADRPRREPQAPNMPAAAYVALSRVEFDANWRFLGDPGVHHFTPARFH
ncbi:unnamed protein product, partial [Effrenium voratum]